MKFRIMNRLPLQLLVLLPVLLLLGCPPVGDDDDSALPPETGPAPVITSVEVCELPAMTNCEEPNFGLRFAITATDEDDNMVNPWWALLIEGNNPSDGRLEANLPSGGTLNLRMCDSWTRGAEIAFETWIKDDEENESNRWEDSWLVPSSPGDDDCVPDVPGR